MKGTVLTIRVRPYDGESFYGYLMRLASVNGRKSVGQLLQLIGLKDKRCYILSAQKEAEGVSDALSPWIMYPPHQLFEHFNDSINAPYIWDPQRSIQDLRVHSPRFCPECFKSKSKRYFRSDWSLLPNTHCTEHGIELVDHCPHCSNSLEWGKSIFLNCSKCGYCWESLTSSSESIPSWQLAFNSAIHDTDCGLNWLRKFCHNVIKAARPFDLVHEQIQRMPDQTINIKRLVEQAWSFSLNNILPSYETREWPPEGFVKTRRLQLLDSINYHITFYGLAQILGIPKNQVRHLVASQIISAIHDSSTIRDMIFDARDAQKVIYQIPEKIAGNYGDIKITPSSRILKLFGLHYGEVIVRGLSDQKLMRSSNSNGLSEVYFPGHYLFQCLNLLMAENLDGEFVPMSRTKQILAVSHDDVIELIKSRDLCLSQHSSSRNQLDGRSILELIVSNHPKLCKRNQLIESLL